MSDLPIVPEHFKLVVRDERSKKQMNVVKRALDRDDVELVVNACDAGREGELIFAYLYEKAGSKLPVQRLWLNSMTTSAIRDAFATPAARPASSRASRHAARSRSEADWIVGMNATRAATIRLRSSFDGAVSLGRVQTPTLAILARREEEIRAFTPEPYWVVDARFLALPEEPRRAYDGRFHAGAQARGSKTEAEASAIVAACEGQTGDDHEAREATSARTAPPLLYDLTSLQSEAILALRLHRAADAGRGPAALRGAQGADLSAHELALHHVRHDRRHQADRQAGRRPARVRAAASSTWPGSTCCRWRASSTTRRSPTTTRSSRRSPSVTRSTRWSTTTARSTTSSSGASWRCSTRRRCSRTRASRRQSPSTSSVRAARCCSSQAGVASTARTADAAPTGRRRRRRGRRAAAAKARAWRAGRRSTEIASRGEGDQAATALLRRLAARRDGDGRQARRRRGAARGDEGIRDRYAGDPRRDHRAAAPGRLHRARRAGAGRHREGAQRDPAARRAR